MAAAITARDRRRASLPGAAGAPGLPREAVASGRDVDVNLAPMVAPRPSPPLGTSPRFPDPAGRRRPCLIMADVTGPDKSHRGPARPAIHLALPGEGADPVS